MSEETKREDTELEEREQPTHDLQLVAEEPSTCTQTGHSAYQQCKNCEYAEEKTELPFADHSFEEPLSFNNDQRRQKCSICFYETEKEDHEIDDGGCTSCPFVVISNGLAFTSNGDGTCAVTGIGTCNVKKISVPEGTCAVTGIGTCNVKKISIPEKSPDGDTVTAIGGSAFYNCSSLTSITIPDSVTSIGYSAFRGCCKLIEVCNKSSLSINAGSTENGYIGYYAKHIITDEEDSYLIEKDGYVFYDDGTNVYLMGYTGTSTSLTLPAQSPKGKNYEIYQYTFRDCNSLYSLTIPDSVTSISDYAFNACINLTSITIPDGVTSIGEGAFAACYGLTSITIPDSVTSIGNAAFAECFSLTSITIPDSVTSIGKSAFSRCSSLESIFVSSGNSVFHSAGNCLIETASKTLIAGCKNSVIPTDGSVTSIGDDAFDGCSSLESITIPNGVTSIGFSAFEDCSNLTSITIPDSVTSIGFSAFDDCDSLNAVYITDLAKWCEISFADSFSNPLSYAHNLYINSTLATSITIPDGVTSIGEVAFYNCSSLTSITIPASVTNIGASMFSGCTNLIQTENGVQYVDKWVIGCDTSVTSVSLRSDTVGIGGLAFYCCISLTSITIPASVTSIGWYAFSDCYKLIEVCNKSSLTVTAGSSNNGYIGYYAKHIITDEKDSYLIEKDNYIFYDDGSDVYLMGYTGTSTSLTLPAQSPKGKNYEIYQYAFYGCSGLTSITFQDTKKKWNAISKADNWNLNTGSYTIHCTDGDIAKS